VPWYPQRVLIPKVDFDTYYPRRVQLNIQGDVLYRNFYSLPNEGPDAKCGPFFPRWVLIPIKCPDIYIRKTTIIINQKYVYQHYTRFIAI
jgi:hypothetical protein